MARLRFGTAHGKRLHYELAEDDFNDLLDALGPLESFGLLQCRYSQKEPMTRPKITHARKTNLFNQLLHFDL